MNKAQLLAFYQVGVKRIEMIQENEFRLINQNEEEIRIVVTEVLTLADKVAKLNAEIAALRAQADSMEAELTTIQG